MWRVNSNSVSSNLLQGKRGKLADIWQGHVTFATRAKIRESTGLDTP
jgi:hypothetical protein